MGSVYVSWAGACRERATQAELLGFIRQLADRHAARWQGPATARPAFLQIMTAQRQQAAPAVDLVRTFDQEITGRIVLDPYLAHDGEGLLADVERSGVEKVAVEAGGTEKQEAFCLSLGSSGARWCLRLARLRVFGVDFRLFDPRELYPDADRIGFVFLDSPELPSLCGGLAQVESQPQCGAYGSDVIRSADWYVSAPSVHLRYHLEDWMDRLLGWVKFFFIPDLRYQRYEPMSGFESIAPLFEECCRERGTAAAKQAAFEALLGQFEREADEWVRRVGQMA
jgi:hypothetical protein